MRRTMTNQQIADFYGVTVKWLYTYLRRRCIDDARVTDWEVAEGIGTKTVKELAYEYNVSTRVIYYRLAKMGICPKQPGQTGGRK